MPTFAAFTLPAPSRVYVYIFTYTSFEQTYHIYIHIYLCSHLYLHLGTCIRSFVLDTLGLGSRSWSRCTASSCAPGLPFHTCRRGRPRPAGLWRILSKGRTRHGVWRLSHVCVCMCMYVYIDTGLYTCFRICIYLSRYLSIHLCICLFRYPSVHPSIHLSIYVSVYQIIYLSIYLPNLSKK